ncbi:3581_t:CDS:1, partial [Cetraspora pellucida]
TNEAIEKNVSIVNNELNSFEHQVTIEINKFFEENIINKLLIDQKIIKLINTDIINQETANSTNKKQQEVTRIEALNVFDILSIYLL